MGDFGVLRVLGLGQNPGGPGRRCAERGGLAGKAAEVTKGQGVLVWSWWLLPRAGLERLKGGGDSSSSSAGLQLSSLSLPRRRSFCVRQVLDSSESWMLESCQTVRLLVGKYLQDYLRAKHLLGFFDRTPKKQEFCIESSGGTGPSQSDGPFSHGRT